MTSKNQRTGVLFINIGTPQAPSSTAVRSYLREFLMDRFVIDIPYPYRWMLVNLIIAPFRAPSSAKQYQTIWTKDGSPLIVHTKGFVKKLKRNLPEHTLSWAMRYGKPSIEQGLRELADRQVTDLLVFPMYPQYSLSAVESSLAEVERLAPQMGFPPERVFFVDDYYDHPGLIGAYASNIGETLESFPADHILFSFHGLPERHVRLTDPSHQHCLTHPSCCKKFRERSPKCYRAQCEETAAGIAAALELEPDQFSVGFQSRLGRQEWLKPYSDHLVVDLANRGIKNIAVCCPAFTSDCLETLEEITIRLDETFRKAGGTKAKLVPSLNANQLWVKAAADIILARKHPRLDARDSFDLPITR